MECKKWSYRCHKLGGIIVHQFVGKRVAIIPVEYTEFAEVWANSSLDIATQKTVDCLDAFADSDNRAKDYNLRNRWVYSGGPRPTRTLASIAQVEDFG
jgi:hypothetical protein